ncbi:MAG: type II toxin-antitoxin system VapC family toxin [Armatimonadetes bacterium]|nr:type II toxin-antitoxin system VapC family toxin [Armatimonadota bacterium]
MRIAMDSSALAKRYVLEPGTDRVISICKDASEIGLCVIAAPELVSVFSRLRREGRLNANQYMALKKNLSDDLAQATIIDLTPPVIEKAVICLEKCPVRTLDALHIASAVVFYPDLFLTADHRQGEAAQRLGLVVERV